MLFDVFRFNLFALDILRKEQKKNGREMSIGEYLEREGYGEGFKEDYLLVRWTLISEGRADGAAHDCFDMVHTG